MRKLTVVAFVVLLAKSVGAQGTSSDTSQYQQGIQAAVSTYFQSIGNGAGLYNGVEHPPYYPKFEGSAYYQEDGWQKATIEYSGIVYRNVQAKYDLIKDQVIVMHPSGISFSLFSPRVSYFLIGGDRFIYLPGGVNQTMPAPGFYQQLRTGVITVLAKRRKIIEEEIQQQEVKRWVTAENQYYLVKDGIYYRPHKEASLLALMGAHRTEARQLLRKARIRFRKAPEQALLTIADYYNK